MEASPSGLAGLRKCSASRAGLAGPTLYQPVSQGGVLLLLKFLMRKTIAPEYDGDCPKDSQAQSSGLDFLAVTGAAAVGLAQNEQNTDPSRMLLPQWGQYMVGKYLSLWRVTVKRFAER